MDTKLKGVWEKIKDFFKNMSTRVRIILAAAVVLIIAAAAAVALWSNNRPYETLFTDLTTDEASAVLSYLDENGLKDSQYTGDTILVRADQRQALLAQLALAGYPKTGSLYGTYFERTGTMSTTSERATAEMVSVMEDLSAIVRTFEGVKDAQVRIDMGEDRTYVLEDISTETTASVKLTLRDGYVLPDKTADAIRGLVAHSIAGLDIESVFVTDTQGNTYSGDSMGDRQDSSALKLKIQENYNNLIRTNVMQALTGIYGAENVKVAVNTTVDVDRRFVENTNYTQPAGSYENGGLIGREQIVAYITREGLEPVGGVVGTESNADLSTYVEDLIQGAGDGDTAGQVIDRDNKINESKEQVEAVAYTVTDVTVAVTINERANPDAAAVDVATLQSHVATASGIGGENPEQYVSVLVAPFLQSEEERANAVLTDVLIVYLVIAGAALLLLIVVLVVLLSIRRKRKQREEEERAAAAEQMGELEGAAGITGLGGITGIAGMEGITPEMAASIAASVPPAGGADIMEINTEKSMELRKSVRQFVQNNPELAAQMVKTWLKGGETENG